MDDRSLSNRFLVCTLNNDSVLFFVGSLAAPSVGSLAAPSLHQIRQSERDPVATYLPSSTHHGRKVSNVSVSHTKLIARASCLSARLVVGPAGRSARQRGRSPARTASSGLAGAHFVTSTNFLVTLVRN